MSHLIFPVADEVRAPRRWHFTIWAAAHWLRSQRDQRWNAWWWEFWYWVGWYALYPTRTQRRYVREYHQRVLAQLRSEMQVHQ